MRGACGGTAGQAGSTFHQLGKNTAHAPAPCSERCVSARKPRKRDSCSLCRRGGEPGKTLRFVRVSFARGVEGNARDAFEALGAARVVWHTDIYNERSQAAIERLGAQREGVLRKHRIRWDGSRRDTVQYAMTDDDWPAARDRLRAWLATS